MSRAGRLNFLGEGSLPGRSRPKVDGSIQPTAAVVAVVLRKPPDRTLPAPTPGERGPRTRRPFIDANFRCDDAHRRVEYGDEEMAEALPPPLHT